MDEELKESRIDLNKDKTFDFDTVKAVVTWWMVIKKGLDSEALECFRFIDSKDKKWISFNDLKNSFNSQNMGFQVTE